MAYALQGFLDGLREQIETVRSHQLQVTWVNYVHEHINSQPAGAARDRQRSLVLAMSRQGHMRCELPTLTPAVALLYAGKNARTLSRDLAALVQLGLVHQEGKRYAASMHVVEGLLPPVGRGLGG